MTPFTRNQMVNKNFVSPGLGLMETSLVLVRCESQKMVWCRMDWKPDQCNHRGNGCQYSFHVSCIVLKVMGLCHPLLQLIAHPVIHWWNGFRQRGVYVQMRRWLIEVICLAIITTFTGLQKSPVVLKSPQSVQILPRATSSHCMAEPRWALSHCNTHEQFDRRTSSRQKLYALSVKWKLRMPSQGYTES